MTSKNVAVSVAYGAVVVQLATYLANDTGRLSEGPFYWTLLYASGITLLGAVVWLVRERSRSRHSQEAR
jgi:hypothetical protein